MTNNIVLFVESSRKGIKELLKKQQRIECVKTWSKKSAKDSVLDSTGWSQKRWKRRHRD